MTDSVKRERPGKRERLVASAADLLHRQGVVATTIAHVAEEADVPPGNVYYYFKTKDDLIRAVIGARTAEVQAMLSALESRRSPAARLKALARGWVEMRELVARHGCPIGSLCTELADRPEGGLDEMAAQPVNLILDWAEGQFREMGARSPRDLAVGFFAGVQGGAVLANALRDPEIMSGEVRRLERWIDSLS
jgi:TetR/AcrR family transcriptional regulator, transcriptional repressor for nem operon